MGHNLFEFYIVDLSNRLWKISKVLCRSQKLIVNCLCLIVTNCPRKNIILGNVTETSLRIFVQKHQVLKIRNDSFLPKFNVNVNVFWVDFVFLVNFLAECVSLLLVPKYKKVAAVWCVDFNGLLDFQVTFLDELIFVFIKLDVKRKWGFLNVSLFPLLGF